MLKKLLALVMLLVGGGGGAWYMYGDDEPAPAEDAAPVEAPEQTRLSLFHSPDFVKLRAITIPTFRDNAVHGKITTEFTLETDSGRDASRILALNVRLRDAYTSELYALAEAEASGLLTIDHEVLKQHLMIVSERLLGPGVVDDVLIRTFVRSR